MVFSVRHIIPKAAFEFLHGALIVAKVHILLLYCRNWLLLWRHVRIGHSYPLEDYFFRPPMAPQCALDWSGSSPHKTLNIVSDK